MQGSTEPALQALIYHVRHPRSVDREESASMAQKVIREFIDDIDAAFAELALAI